MSENSNNNLVVALGCRLNIFEAELIKEQANKAGLKNTIVVNTCTVTQQAHRQSMQSVRKLKKDNPNAQIIVTGCGVQVDKEGYAKMPEVSKVIGNKDKLNLDALLNIDKIVVNDINEDFSTDYVLPQIQGFENKTRAFIQIQQGCDHRCSFCIIYQARGKSRSVSKDDIINQIKQVVAFGHKDVVLTGVDISSWERDALLKTPSKIGYLCKEILHAVPNLDRLRLSSLDPDVTDKNILDLLKNEPRFMPHLHLSLQAMSDPVLKNMGRRHSKESAIAWIEDIRSANKNTVLGADIICGFPRETAEQYDETVDTLVNLNIPFLHVFPYSQRDGTVAAKMKPISLEQRKARANALIQKGLILKENLFKSKIGSVEKVLLERGGSGYTKDYCLVKVQGDNLPKATIANVKITGFNKNNLEGYLL